MNKVDGCFDASIKSPDVIKLPPFHCISSFLTYHVLAKPLLVENDAEFVAALLIKTSINKKDKRKTRKLLLPDTLGKEIVSMFKTRKYV